MNNKNKINIDKINNLLNKLDPDNKVFSESKKIHSIIKKYKKSNEASDLEELYDEKLNNKKFKESK